MGKLQVGDEAPDFDLASTEGAVLMLRDEIARTPVLLAFLSSPAAAGSRLDALARAAASRQGGAVNVLVVSPAPLEELRAEQARKRLPFPLLHDDRGFSRLYGVESGDEAEAGALLVLVDRDQRIRGLEDDTGDWEAVLAELLAQAGTLPSPTVNYPRSVINRFVDRWVN